MIPESGQWQQEFIVKEQPNKTYRLDAGMISGFTDGLEAIKQAIYKILNTERYCYSIYSYDYGIELENLFGRSRDFIYSELEVRISEALYADSRIIKVKDFNFESSQKSITVKFIVESELGSFESESVVERTWFEK